MKDFISHRLVDFKICSWYLGMIIGGSLDPNDYPVLIS